MSRKNRNKAKEHIHPMAAEPTTQSNSHARRSRTDWWVAGPTIGALVVSLIIGSFSMWATQQQLMFTREQLKQSGDQLTQARHAEQVDERPWLAVTGAGVDTGANPGIYIRVKNNGRTPATKMKFQWSGAHPNSNYPNLLKYPHYTRSEVEGMPTEGSIPQGEEHVFKDLTFLGVPASDAESYRGSANKWARGQFILTGGVAYTDEYGTEGFTGFCILLVDGQFKGGCPGSPYME